MLVLTFQFEKCSYECPGPYIAGGGGGSMLFNIVFAFVGLYLVDILVRNLEKTD